MSVYSGFATRQQETFYNRLIEKALELMSDKLIMFFNTSLPHVANSEENKVFFNKIRKIQKCLAKMDKTKYLQPHFGETMNPLGSYIKSNFDTESMSTITSKFSMFKNADLTSSGGNSALLDVQKFLEL